MSHHRRNRPFLAMSVSPWGMAKREPLRASPKLLGLLKDFQAIASMAGYLTHTMDPPQLRLMFTLYGRLAVGSEEEATALVPGLQAWCERISQDLREGSSSAILPPQILIANPQPLPSGQWYLVATLTFTTKVTDASYLRVRTAVLKAYKRAIVLREKGLEAAMEPVEASEDLEILPENALEPSQDAEEPEGSAALPPEQAP